MRATVGKTHRISCAALEGFSYAVTEMVAQRMGRAYIYSSARISFLSGRQESLVSAHR